MTAAILVTVIRDHFRGGVSGHLTISTAMTRDGRGHVGTLATMEAGNIAGYQHVSRGGGHR